MLALKRRWMHRDAGRYAAGARPKLVTTSWWNRDTRAVTSAPRHAQADAPSVDMELPTAAGSSAKNSTTPSTMTLANASQNTTIPVG